MDIFPILTPYKYNLLAIKVKSIMPFMLMSQDKFCNIMKYFLKVNVIFVQQSFISSDQKAPRHMEMCGKHGQSIV